MEDFRFSVRQFGGFSSKLCVEHKEKLVGIRVSDPDRIQIQSGQWIRIRIRNPDPEGNNDPPK
jgi:hypothetical protein